MLMNCQSKTAPILSDSGGAYILYRCTLHSQRLVTLTPCGMVALQLTWSGGDTPVARCPGDLRLLCCQSATSNSPLFTLGVALCASGRNRTAAHSYVTLLIAPSVIALPSRGVATALLSAFRGSVVNCQSSTAEVSPRPSSGESFAAGSTSACDVRCPPHPSPAHTPEAGSDHTASRTAA